MELTFLQAISLYLAVPYYDDDLGLGDDWDIPELEEEGEEEAEEEVVPELTNAARKRKGKKSLQLH